jgi:hypothetical protein
MPLICLNAEASQRQTVWDAPEEENRQCVVSSSTIPSPATPERWPSVRPETSVPTSPRCVRRATKRPACFLRAAFDSWRGRLPAIEVTRGRPEEYDFVLLMGPVWVGHAATPVRAYLTQNRGKLKRAAFLLTFGGSCSPRAFQEMAALAAIAPDATLMLSEREIKASSALPALASFLSSIKVSKAAA